MFFFPIRKGEASPLAVRPNLIFWLSYAGQKINFKQKYIPERSKLLSFFSFFLDLWVLTGHRRLTFFFFFFSLSKHFTNPLAAVTTCVPWHGAAGSFVVELAGLCRSGVAGIRSVDPVLRIDARCAKIRGLASHCLFAFNRISLLLNLSCSKTPQRSAVG